MKKKIIIFTILALIVIVGLAWYFYARQASQFQLNKLKQDHPEWAGLVDDVIKYENALKEDEANVGSYLSLGLAWKSLADKAYDLKLENYKEYYSQALEAYEKGIIVTNRRNTLLITNAGNMAKYLEDYQLAEDYYKEAITVSPGDVTYYVLLAELYEYKTNKTLEEVVAVYDEGMKWVINPEFLEKRKQVYLKRANN